MLSIENLTKSYGATRALDGLSLQVAPGEVFALLGANGAGKTTAIHCVLGFVEPDGGRVVVDGIDVGAQPVEARRRLAYIPEQVNLYGHFSGVENLAYFSELGGRRHGAESLREFLALAGLPAEAHARRVSGYSKGMRQKVGIAIALAKEARVVLLDEPTSGLDPRAAYDFSQLLKTLSARGVAALMATHDLFRAKEEATRVGIMRQGRLAHVLTAAEFSHTALEQLYLETTRL